MNIILLTVVTLARCGCASSGAKIDTDQLTEIRKGQTTVAEIVRRFGRPNVLSKNWDGTQTAAYANTGGGSDAGTLLPLMGAVVAGARTSVDSVIFYFDTSGMLTDYKSNKATQPEGTQPVQASAAEPIQTQTGASAPAQPGITKPALTRPAVTSKKRDPSGLPWWLPSEVRDLRQ